ncbi:agarase [Verrucomicrobia bacterium S94]|nr:agarase [Verrucomicrobia bacterium S94]
MKRLILGVAAACVLQAVSAEDGLVLYRFNSAEIPEEAEAVEAELAVKSGVLEVKFRPEEKRSGFMLTPAEPWDCAELGQYRLSVNITNPGEVSTFLLCTVKSGSGGEQRRCVNIPAGSSGTYYFELEGDGLGTDKGLRDDPPSLIGCGTKMIIKGGKWEVDYSKVRSVFFYTERLLHPHTLIFDDIQILKNPPIDPDYMIGLVDRFGQAAKIEYSGKIHSEEELRQVALDELRALAVSRPMPDRSTFGGWKEGPRLEATGYFRTEKIGGKWALVDPEGYLFFSSGIANIRMANTSTITGIDFKDDAIRYVDPEDVTPEDSLGIVPPSDEIRKTRYVSSELRHRMFQWLPDYADPLAKYYGYRRSAHKGPVPHGEVFSFYLANLERRYGEPRPGFAVSKWRDVTIDRMIDWGFTSTGNWVDPEFYQNNRFPYFANGWIIGDFKTVSSGHDHWRPLPDPFDPEFERRAELTLKVVADEVLGSPWCVGVFVDNEMSWGSMESTAKRYGVVLHALNRPVSDCPTKAEFMQILRGKYRSIGKLNDAWGTDLTGWNMLETGIDFYDADFSDAMLEDFSVLSEAYASQYFKVVHDALADVLPNHLYMGCRLTSWGMTTEVWKAARKYCDVMSFNSYTVGIGKKYWKFLEEVDRPTVIGEFHMGAGDSGFFNPGLIHAADQQDRGRMWKAYMESVRDNPYFVGAHWFQYIDSPITGRAHDGENYNIGFVSVTDIPYPHLVKAAKEFHCTLYETRYGDVKEAK